MVLRWQVQRNVYADSVKLMRVSEALSRHPGVERAAAMMATPLNVELLAGDGLLPPDLAAKPDDLVVAVRAVSEQAGDRALDLLAQLLAARVMPPADTAGAPIRSLEQAAQYAGATLAIIAVPGTHAATEAYAALRAGMHVFLFSDNVALADEVRLKQIAAERDLLMMGPDCGTAILGGMGLGFANRVRSGPVGIVGASGTGIQHICCLLDAAGVGIAQAIGTGGRDLSSTVDASMTRRALWMMEGDPAVEVIALISKPADQEVAQRLHRELMSLHKPAVVCLLGDVGESNESVRYADTLTEAAALVVHMVNGKELDGEPFALPPGATRPGKRVAGLFAGGTLLSEAQRILDSLGVQHRLTDLGDDHYTRGRAHPIIDPRLRASMLAALWNEPGDIGVILVDIILGDLADADPAGALLPALRQRNGSIDDRPLVVATLVGARRDPQGLSRQRAKLEKAGVLVFSSNAQAARTAAAIVARQE